MLLSSLILKKNEGNKGKDGKRKLSDLFITFGPADFKVQAEVERKERNERDNS